MIGEILGSITGNGLISGAASLIGGMLGKSGADSANAQNWAAMHENHKFQERMSSTAYQRAVEDMKAAGLNPMLAYSQGGASSPGGGVGNAAINAKGAGVDAGMKAASATQLASQTELTNAQAASTAKDAELKQIEIDKAKMQYGDGMPMWQKMADAVWRELESREEVQRWKARLNKDEWNLLQEEIKNAVATRGNIEANTGNTRVNTALHQLQIPVSENIARYARETGLLSPALNDLGKLSNSAGDLSRLRKPTYTRSAR